MVLPFNVALYSGVSVAALFAAAGADAYAVGGNAPEFVADFAGTLNSGTEYYRSGGSDTTFSNVFTHSGLVAPATMTDSDGNLKWAPHNLIDVDSEQLTGIFGSSVSVTNNDTTAPNGTTTASRFTSTATATNKVGQAFSYIWESAANVTGAAYLKAGTCRYVGFGDSSGAPYVIFDLQLGTVHATSGTTNETITSVGDGWYLCTFRPAGAGSFFCIFGDSDGTSSGWAGSSVTSGEYYWAWGVHLYRSDLGGMVNNPDTGDSYVPTTTAARFLPRRNHYIYNGTSWENAGILIEPAAATNLLLNSGTLSTQSVTVTAVAHTLHFTGTGTITLSGASTAGPLVGTGTGENNRVSLTFTPSAGSLTCTVSGTVTNAQLEVGSVRTSYIPTAGSTVTRAAETLTVAGANLPYSATAMSFQQQGRMNFADDDGNPTLTFFDWRDGGAYLGQRIQTNGSNTGLFVGYSVLDSSFDVTDDYVPGINVSYNNASRHTNDLVQAAKQGSAHSADSDPTATPAVSSGTLRFGSNSSVGSPPFSVALFRAWGTDIGEDGIETAST